MWTVDVHNRRRRRAERASREKPDRRATLIVERDGQREVVRACCERARRAGARPGLPLAQARALFPGGNVRIEPHDARSERAALRALASWATRFSPVVAVDEPDGLRLDVTGCAHLFGGEPRMIHAVQKQLGRLGVSSRAAIAPTFGCAWGVARFAPADRRIIGPGDLRDALANLPARALRLSDQLAHDLDTLGLRSVSHLLELPRSALAARFGDELSRRLDQALGEAFEMIDPVRHVPPLSLERLFQGPTTQTEAIELATRQLLQRGCESLLRREAGAQRWTLELLRSDLPPERIELRVSRPLRDAARVWKLAAPKLERAHLGFGVEGLRLRLSAIGRVRHEQDERWTPSGADAARIERESAELLDTLANRLGAGRVLKASLAESHRPERATRWRSGVAVETPPETAPPAPRDRPTVLFDRPEPAQVVALSPDGPVHRVRFGGADHEIARCRGPERLAPEWWRETGSTRDYFAVQTTSGRWVWVARSLESGRWYVCGVWG